MSGEQRRRHAVKKTSNTRMETALEASLMPDIAIRMIAEKGFANVMAELTGRRMRTMSQVL
jgi:tryptophan 2,3-dioxygenase